MENNGIISSGSHAAPQEKKLFTPGPLCVSRTVKEALCRDMGSRDTEFIQIVKNLRDNLVKVAGLSQNEFTAVLMQGSGTFSVESVLLSTSNRKQKVLIVANGAYGQRMKIICEKAEIPYDILVFPETQVVDVERVLNFLESQPNGIFSSVAVIHCETTTGIINPTEKLGEQLKQKFPAMTYIVDAMSSFAAVEANYSQVDFLISSANKCLQGVPGFGFVICRLTQLEKCKGLSKSLALDLYEQWKGLEENGQFRFTPPTHAILGLTQACKELEAEGGVAGRARRYKKNSEIIKVGMAERGFKQLIEGEEGHITTTFFYPSHENFNFQKFYNELSDLGQLIYPGKVTNAACFRIGHIGHLDAEDMRHLLKCIDQVLSKMNIPCPLQ
ncbi:unnamed protein product [Orchesella dallaii]|uniref:Alanine--glyoxylate aminotransferase n=1 Tax=Orchesella dallaii TaxID=48710 RepID=A0ABP1QVM8_9HEXA